MKIEMDGGDIIQGDCIQVMQSLPEQCADLVFADPPYNLQLRKELYRPDMSRVDAVNDGWDQFMSFEAYDRFTREWLLACRRVLKDTGTIWVIGTYHNIFRVGSILQDLGYWILNDICWVKSNPMPQFRGVRFCNAHETLIWAKKSAEQKRYTFHYGSLKAGNEDLQARSDWYLPICQGRERLRDANGKVHTTQKPEALLHRIIRSCTNPGDTVLDPFLGAGTTASVAKRLGRRFIGIEREDAYVDAGRMRIESVTPAPDESLAPPPPQPERVAFSVLLELGLVREGDRLRLGSGPLFGLIHADGTISSNGARGSIHFVGAHLLGAAGCNGWTAWMARPETGIEYQPLDRLRQRARELLKEPAAIGDGGQGRDIG